MAIRWDQFWRIIRYSSGPFPGVFKKYFEHRNIAVKKDFFQTARCSIRWHVLSVSLSCLCTLSTPLCCAILSKHQRRFEKRTQSRWYWLWCQRQNPKTYRDIASSTQLGALWSFSYTMISLRSKIRCLYYVDERSWDSCPCLPYHTTRLLCSAWSPWTHALWGAYHRKVLSPLSFLTRANCPYPSSPLIPYHIVTWPTISNNLGLIGPRVIPNCPPPYAIPY